VSFLIQKKKQGLVFKIQVLPGSSKNAIVGVLGDALKIKLKAPPVDGAANKMCVGFFSKILKVPKSSIKIISGHKSKKKQIYVMPREDNDILRLRKLIMDMAKNKGGTYVKMS